MKRSEVEGNVGAKTRKEKSKSKSAYLGEQAKSLSNQSTAVRKAAVESQIEIEAKCAGVL